MMIFSSHSILSFIFVISPVKVSKMNLNTLGYCILLAALTTTSQTAAFTGISAPFKLQVPFSQTSTSLQVTRRTKRWTAAERDAIIQRNGEYFKLDRMRGKIEFGSSSRINTRLEGADVDSIKKWLSNDRAIAMSIWDEKLIREVEPEVYRLKLMTLMFVTIQLAPHVDVRMWTEGKDGDNVVFKLESVAFDPNIQILPGVGLSAESLGILIDVVGELYPSADGKGVDGKIGFVSSGELPPPMRLLPEPALRSSLSTINKTIANFAISSFQKGARTKYREFLKEEEMSR
ncbi:hypothetical protein ACHAXS_012647 [Conticribra weissflogii]